MLSGSCQGFCFTKRKHAIVMALVFFLMHLYYGFKSSMTFAVFQPILYISTGAFSDLNPPEVEQLKPLKMVSFFKTSRLPIWDPVTFQG